MTTRRDLMLGGAALAASAAMPAFGADLSDQTRLGKCTVNFPIRHHRVGEMLVPSWWNAPDPEQFFLVDGIQSLTAEAYASIPWTLLCQVKTIPRGWRCASGSELTGHQLRASSPSRGTSCRTGRVPGV